MLSSSSARKPPPVPPKPRPFAESMSIEATKRCLGLLDSDNVETNCSREGGDGIVDSASSIMIDAKRFPKHCHGDDQASTIDKPVSSALRASRFIQTGPIVFDSTSNVPKQGGNYISRDSNHGVARQFDNGETNNNLTKPTRANLSSVDVPDAPVRHQIFNSRDDKFTKTFIKGPKQVQRDTTSFSSSNPIVRPAIDDDDELDCIESETKLPTEIEVELLSNDSIDNQPPRTSTPTLTHCQLSSNSSSGASTATYNNRSSQNTQPSYAPLDSNGERTDDDTLNISRDTDELTNSSVHNQSGCELVGVNDTSDSKDSTRIEDKVPYIVQDFDETTMSYNTPHKNVDNPQISLAQSSYFERDNNNDLRKLVKSMQDEIDKLNCKVSTLTLKVGDLEKQVDNQQKERDLNLPASNIHADQQNGRVSPSDKRSFSQSTSTINKLTPLKSNKLNTSYAQSTTYSRKGGSRYGTPSSTRTLCGSNSMSQSSNKNVTNPIEKSRYHASTSSLYLEGARLGNSNSISPSFNGQYNQTSVSPTSNLNLANKRDNLSYTSMLSLSSLCHSNNSTLKKGGAISGSISNLSHISTPLSNWPSMSNFVDTKHQAKDILYDEDERVIRMVLYNNSLTMRPPSWIENNYNLDRIIEAPAVKLKLDWVYGYRGRDCRSNIYHLPTGECIYFVASIVVLFNPEENTQRHYLGHTDTVKCLAIHPNKLIVASGQSAILNRRDKRPIVRVWNSVNLNTLRVIGFNEDLDSSICCLAFSKHDQGATLAVVDESKDHTITLLDWQREKNWRLAEANSGHESVLAIDFHPIDKYSLVAVGKGSVNFWDIRGMTMAKKTGLIDKYDKPKYVLCSTFNDLGETITGDSNGNIIIWPRGSNKPRRVIYDAHPGGVFSILAMKAGGYLSGGRDRRIIEWNEEFEATGRHSEIPEHCGGVRLITCARGSQVIIGTLRNSILTGSMDTDFKLIMQGHSVATSALATHPSQAKYLTGGFDDQISLIDSKTHQIEWTKCIAAPATAASFSRDGLLAVIGSTFGKWFVVDIPSQEVLFSASEGSGTINCVKFSPDGEHFALGSLDSNVYIYSTTENGSKFSRVGTCVGHSAPIKEMDWSDDGRYLQTQSMNFELLIWKAQNCRPIDDHDVGHDIKWSTQNCTLGFNTIGIWSDSIDSALINYCDKSNDDKLMVAVTDTGFINVYKWPTCFNQCLSQKYYGNVEKFNFIKFLPDNSRLIAIGSKSCVTTEWVVESSE